MGAFSLNSRAGLGLVALIVLSIFLIVSRMPGGIGGTGITGAPGGIGGTGIYGRIDAFGSIWVNGVEIFYDEDQNVVRQGRDGLPERLAIGQMVAVTIDDDTGRAEAKTIEIIEEVAGPVTLADEDQIVILGQLVLLTDDTIIDLPGENYEGAEKLAVGGYRTTDGEIIASHISAPLVADEAALRGKIDRVETDAFWIEEQKIVRPRHLYSVGEHVEIRGVVERTEDNKQELRAEKIKRRGAMPFDKLPKELSYQSLINYGGYHKELAQYNAQVDADKTMVDGVFILKAEVKNKDGMEMIVTDRTTITVGRSLRAQKASEILRERKRTILSALRPLEAGNVIRADNENMTVDGETRRERVEDRLIGRVVAPDPDAGEPDNVAEERRAEIQERRQAEMERRRATLLENEQARARIEARRQELQKIRLAAANQRRLIAVEARSQAILEARREALENELPERDEIFAPQELEQMIKDGDLSREALREIQRNIRERVQGEIRDGARLEAREEVRKRVREEIRRRIRRQLREQ